MHHFFLKGYVLIRPHGTRDNASKIIHLIVNLADLLCRGCLDCASTGVMDLPMERTALTGLR
jgi:hypothetical protein